MVDGSPSPPTVRGHDDRDRSGATAIKLGYSVGYWSAGPPPGALDAIKEAERLGFDSLWTAEAYGSDALTPLAWWGAQTERIRLGTGIVQLSARTPDGDGDGGDHARPPLRRARASSASARPARRSSRAGTASRTRSRSPARASTSTSSARSSPAAEPVEHHGEFYDLPLDGGTGLGKALKSTVHPLRTEIPIHIAAEGPKNVALAGRDRRRLAAAVLRAEGGRVVPRVPASAASPPAATRRKAERFEVTSSVTIVPGDDVERCADADPPDARPLRRRHGRPRRQLPLRGVRPHGLRGRRHQGPGAVPRAAARTRRRRRSRWRWSRTSPSSARRRRSARSCRAGGTRASRRSSSAGRRRRSTATPRRCSADRSLDDLRVVPRDDVGRRDLHPPAGRPARRRAPSGSARRRGLRRGRRGTSGP